MLALAATLACRALERRIGSAAPLLVGLAIFGSASWALVWTSGADLVTLALAVTAFTLAYGGGGADEAPTEIYRPQEAAGRGLIRWLAVGLLLAELVPTGLLLAGLLIPAALAVPPERRRSFLPLLLGGFALGAGIELGTGGAGFLSGPIGVSAETFRLSPELAGWNIVHLLVGRNVGLLAGFAPLLLLLTLGRDSSARPGLATVCGALAVLGPLALPFDFAGGWLNLSFLPLYGALWHLPARQPRRWEWVVVVLLCGLGTWPLWVMPRAAVAEEGVALTASWPRRYLPYEASLRSLPNRGEAELAREGVRVRAVSGCRFLGDSSRFELDDTGPAEIWLAAPAGLEMVALEFGPGAPSRLELSGAEAGRTVFRPDGRVGFEVLLTRQRGRHGLWFGESPLAVHLLEIRAADREGTGALRFRLLAAPQP
jgi:hypothetical protein